MKGPMRAFDSVGGVSFSLSLAPACKSERSVDTRKDTSEIKTNKTDVDIASKG